MRARYSLCSCARNASTTCSLLVDPDMEHRDVEIDGEVGVAVLFNEEEQDKEDKEGYEIQEETDNEEKEGEDETKEAGEGEQDTSADELVIGGSSAAFQAGKAKADEDVVSPHTIDGF